MKLWFKSWYRRIFGPRRYAHDNISDMCFGMYEEVLDDLNSNEPPRPDTTNPPVPVEGTPSLDEVSREYWECVFRDRRRETQRRRKGRVR